MRRTRTAAAGQLEVGDARAEDGEEGAEGERRVRAVGSVERAGSRRRLNRASYDTSLPLLPDSRL